MRILSRIFRLGMALALALIGASSALAAGAQQDEVPQVRITQVDNSQFPKVTVYVSVTNAAGEPVGIDAGQIQIYENGQLMTLDSIGGKGDIGTLTSMLVLDTSGSMNEAGKLEAAKGAAIAYIEQMRAGDQAGLITFNSSVEVVQPLTSDPATLKAAINAIRARNDTAMYDGLSAGVDALKDVSGRKTVILLSDGLDNVSNSNADQVTEAIGPAGLSISTIGLGDPGQLGSNSGLDEAGLRSLADRAGGAYAFANDSDALRAIYERYARALQSEYQLTYTSPLTLRDGANRNLNVSLGAAGAAGSAEARYNPGGVLPEVAQSISWPIFGAVLVGLLILLFIPFFLNLGGQAFKGFGSKRGGRVKLGGEPGGGSRKANIKIK